MATSNVVCALVLSTLFHFVLVHVSSREIHVLKKCGFQAIYQLGDSLADSGNLIRENPLSPYASFPYGLKLSKPTGRCSNGRAQCETPTQMKAQSNNPAKHREYRTHRNVWIDEAHSAKLPYLDAYLNLVRKSFGGLGGVNFAVAGSTALPEKVLSSKNIMNLVTNESLSTQLKWMSTYFNTCSKDCDKEIKSSLFMVGEIGGNDYNFGFLFHKTTEEMKALAPEVVKAIKHAVVKVIGHGARRVVVPGNFPIGCFPVYLSQFQPNDTAAYDEFKCIKGLNSFSRYHNELLKQTVEGLKKQYPDVIIVYGDYYKAFMSIYQNAQSLGFDTKSIQKACCGTGAGHNFSLTRMCGAPGVPVCPNPDHYISWDGIHLTQKAYQHMAEWLINDIFPKLQCSS
uniref:SGNH hydrolase-type esterase domain-containing protein n=1 Tax=Salix viminalis TaxID=40686 RepID=A0A6N2KTN1_SALVM